MTRLTLIVPRGDPRNAMTRSGTALTAGSAALAQDMLNVTSNAARFRALLMAALLYGLAFISGRAQAATPKAPPMTSSPYSGPSHSGVDVSTLHHKVMCGYQGWFTCEGDGAGLGWNHYRKGRRFEPGSCTIDLWPDVSELDDDEKYPTAFRHADGTVTYAFSSFNRKTVLRHFRWMQQYGIDGAFVQRFATSTFHPGHLRRVNAVLAHCREGANRYGRAYAVMYDLSGMKAGQMPRVMDDWRRLVAEMGITRGGADRAYLHHKGKPVVAVWGMGFKGRPDTLEECARLVDFLKTDPTCGGCTLMLGLPTGWRTLDRDATRDKRLLDIVAKADVVSPWTVGRYRDLAGAARHARQRWAPDMVWCRQRGKDYLPVVFPGFSWFNLKGEKFNAIPRRGGRFLWKQFFEAKRAGASMLYVAMFDEIDEGTAVFKCTNAPPVGASRFLTYEGLPADHYLKLVGAGARMLREEIPVTEEMPKD